MASRTTKLLFILLVAGLLIVAGCSGTDTSDDSGDSGDSQPKDSGSGDTDTDSGALTPPPLPEG